MTTHNTTCPTCGCYSPTGICQSPSCKPKTTFADDLARCLGAVSVTVTVIGTDGEVESVTESAPRTSPQAEREMYAVEAWPWVYDEDELS